MKFIHLSDLHLGKRVNEFSMLDDQKYILNQIIQIVKDKDAKVVIIAGDVYDRQIPPQEAVGLLDDFLTKLNNLDTKVLIISGNHDSDERLAFCANLLERTGVYLSPVYNSKLKTVSINDEYGQIDFVLMPFLRPAQVRRYYPDVETETDAIKTMLENIVIKNTRKVLIAHQFVTANGEKPEQCDSEVLSVGTLGSIDVNLIKDFNYVALGHIHGAQRIGYDHVRYAGSPLKYSFSEVNHQKSVPVIELDASGNVGIELIQLKPKRDMRKIKGSLNEILSHKTDEKTDDYMHITLTDDAVMDAMNKVRSVYPNTMNVEFENFQTKQLDIPVFKAGKRLDLPKLFADFFDKQNGQELSDEMIDFLHNTLLYGQEG